MSDLISAHAFARAAGLSYRQVDYWCRQGVLIESVPADGPGSRRLLPGSEVYVARALRALQGAWGGAAGKFPVQQLVEPVRRSFQLGEPVEIIPGLLVDALHLLAGARDVPEAAA